LQRRKKMIPALTAVIELFARGAALAVSIYLLWKKEKKEDDTHEKTH